MLHYQNNYHWETGKEIWKPMILKNLRQIQRKSMAWKYQEISGDFLFQFHLKSIRMERLVKIYEELIFTRATEFLCWILQLGHYSGKKIR